MGILKSTYLILKFRPSLIVGFGGYTSIPTILAAKIFNTKTLIHEQNALMEEQIEFYQSYQIGQQ